MRFGEHFGQRQPDCGSELFPCAATQILELEYAPAVLGADQPQALEIATLEGEFSARTGAEEAREIP